MRITGVWNPTAPGAQVALASADLRAITGFAAACLVFGGLAMLVRLMNGAGIAFGILMLSLFWAPALLVEAMIWERTLVIDDGARVSIAAPLRFEPRFTVNALTLSGFALVTLAGAIIVASWFVSSGSPLPRLAAAILPVGLWGSFSTLIRKLHPAALTLDEDGVWWWGVFGQHSIDWADLEIIIGAKKLQRYLILTDTTTNSSHKLDQTFFGSDPRFVAEVLIHFRDHPRDRQTLGEPLDALRLVADIRTDV